MVFHELLSFWRDASSLNHVFASFGDMIVTSKHMFALAGDALFAENVDIGQIKRQLIKMDARLNTLQQVIRRDIIMHIAVQGKQDIVPCLVMMSIIKDAERTGDYAKNLCEAAEHYTAFRGDPLFKDLNDMRGRIAVWYDMTLKSFEESNKELARETREDAYALEKLCDKLIWSLAADNQGRNAVAPALVLRYFKRIAAHLGNIVTTIVMPFDKIDFYSQDT